MISTILNTTGIWASVASLMFAITCREKDDNKIACRFVLACLWPLTVLNMIFVPIFSVILVLWKLHIMLSSIIIMAGDIVLRTIAMLCYRYSVATDMLNKGEITLIEGEKDE